MKLHWPIDQMIDSYIDWSLTKPSWDRRRLTSGLIQYDQIQYSLCFLKCANQAYLAQRDKKQQKHTWINNSGDPVTLHELKQVCQCYRGTGLKGFNRDFEVQHCHLWTGVDCAGSQWITSLCWGCCCLFFVVDAVDQTKRSKERDGWILYRIYIRGSFYEVKVKAWLDDQ